MLLKSKCPRLADAIERIGPIRRAVNSDLFSSVVHSIVGQQISMAAQITVWRRLNELLGEITPAAVCKLDTETLKNCGLSYRKTEYIQDFARKVDSGELDLEALREKNDDEIIRQLSALRGIGVWTAEMLLIFCLQRPDVFSFGDLAIHRGLRMLYHHRNVDKKRFEMYRRRFSPHCSLASFYLWAISNGAVEGMKDYAPKKRSAARG